MTWCDLARFAGDLARALAKILVFDLCFRLRVGHIPIWTSTLASAPATSLSFGYSAAARAPATSLIGNGVPARALATGNAL